MPWCEDCAKFWNPNSLPPDGTCPTCGRMIGDPPDTSVPWHFWILLVALALYLGWRVVQGFGWLSERGLTWLAIVLSVALVGGLGWLGSWWYRSRDRTSA